MPEVLAVVLMFVVFGGLFLGILVLNTLSGLGQGSLPRHMKEAQFAYSASHLVAEVNEAVKHCQIPSPKKTVLKQQAREVSDNIRRAVWKLHHLRKIRHLAARTSGSSYTAQVVAEVSEMESKLLHEMDRSLEVLFSIPLALMKVELAQGERTADRLLTELREANLRMRDMADTYDEMRSATPEAAYN